MTIKHIVLSGGSYKGLYTLGVLYQLSQKQFYKMENIESVFATSVGTVLGTILQLKLDWNDVLDYIIKRPWHKTFKLPEDILFEIMGKNGVFNIDIFTSILEKLFLFKELQLQTITLKEFYEFSNVEFHIFVLTLNTFRVESFSHLTHPNLRLIDAIYMSCSIPLVFQPFFFEGSYRTDGGVLCNFPLQYCTDKYPNKKEILGIHIKSNIEERKLAEGSNLLISTYFFFDSLITHSNKNILSEIPNYIVIPCKSRSIDTLEKLLKNEHERAKFIEEGKKFADLFLSCKQSQSSMKELR